MRFEKLEDIAIVTAGTSPKGELINSEGAGMPFFQGSKEFGDLYPTVERYTAFPVRTASRGDILISVRAPVGEVNLALEDCAIGRGVMAISPNLKTDRDFIFYHLKSLQGKWDSLGSTGSVFENLSASTLRAIEIPAFVPREKIGAVLSGLDAKIGADNQMAATLEEIAQTIFKSWFIDFDPVKAKMAGEKLVGMDDATAALFPDSMEDSELGSIPKGWKVKPAGEVFAVGIGRTPPRKEPEWFCDGGDGVPWVSIRDMGTFGVFSGWTNEGLTKAAIDKHRVPIVPSGTVLMSFKLTVGKLCITDRELVTNEAIAHFKLMDDSRLGSSYSYLWLSNQNMSALDSTSSIGVATNSGVIKSIRFLIPTKAIHEAFEQLIAPVFSEINNLSAQSRQLSQIRDCLLPRLISGELQIPEEMLVS